MKLLKQTGGLIAMEYGLLVIAVLSSTIFFLDAFETSVDALLTEINSEITDVDTYLEGGSSSATVQAVSDQGPATP